MNFLFSLLQWIVLMPVLGGSVFGILCTVTFFIFKKRAENSPWKSSVEWPPVTLLKPVRGLERNQRANLRSACMQDYPYYQVVFSAQDPADPVIPLLKEIQKEFGTERVTVVIESFNVGPNGKINNLIGAFSQVRNDVLVISDSDVYLRPDYLKTIIAPLSDPEVGYVCTLYKAVGAKRWFEKMELLTFNADFTPSVVFAEVTGASRFCLGASLAFRRSSLEEMGGFESLSDYLVEDYEIGRRIWSSGKNPALVPYFVEITVDCKDFTQWWNHQVYWDQNTRAAQPAGFFASILTRSIPFALVFVMLRLGDLAGLAVLAGAMCLRIATSGAIMLWGQQDYEGLKSLWLLPLRDMAALVSWVLSFTKRTVIWRGSEFTLTREGRLIPKGQ
jgi:ceramide glucosyltransferase